LFGGVFYCLLSACLFASVIIIGIGFAGINRNKKRSSLPGQDQDNQSKKTAAARYVKN
tara:strand:- start:470 stop:643 length:174 start_codon:yes stop_codon:yes gene_type:complete